MYLKSLVLKGFKSFADRSALSLEPGITAIVGPNGSGKSNISDAVLWVLGERNAKHLRGQAMEDVIFAGSSARKATGLAEVDLVLDNTDGTLPIDFSEVAITRRMYRSGESEYLINGTPARRMDVLDILHDTGLGTGTHSIISQGSLDSILQSKPEDRRVLIEEAAGVLKHKQRKAKSERKLEHMDQHLARVRDVVAEVQRQLGPLERKAKRAMAYQGLSAELSELTLQLAVDDLRGLQRIWDDTCTREKNLTAELEEKRKGIAQAQARVGDLQEKIRLESLDASDSARRHRSATSALDHIDSASLLMRERRRSAKDRAVELEALLATNEEKKKQTQDALHAAEEQLSALSEQRKVADERVEALVKASDEIASKRTELEQENVNLGRASRQIEAELDVLRAKQAQTQEELSQGLAHAKLIESHSKELFLQVEAAQNDAQSLAKAHELASKELEELSENDAKCRTEAAAALVACDEARSRADEARDAQNALENEISALQEIERASSAASGPARAWLVENASEIAEALNPLSHAIVAPKGKEALVEHLLGQDVAALLVSNKKSAARLQEALVAHKLKGAITLVMREDESKAGAGGEGEASTDANNNTPSTSPAETAYANKKLPAGCTPLLSQLKFATSDARAVSALLGDVVLCPTFDAALNAHAADEYGLRFATEDGALVWPSGKITLGAKDAESEEGALSRARRQEEANARLKEATSKHKEASEQAQKAEETLRKVQAKSLEVSQSLAKKRGQVEAARAEVERAQEKLSALRRELDDISKQKEAAEKLVNEARPSAENLAQKIEELVEKLAETKDKLARAQEEVLPLREEATRTSEALSEAKLAQAKLEERQTYTARVRDGRKNELAQIEESSRNAQHTLAKKRMSATRMEPLLALFDLLAQNAREWTRKLEDAAKVASETSSGLHNSVSEARTQAKQAQELFDGVNEKLGSVRIDKGRLEVQVEAAINSIVHDCKTPLETALALPELADRGAVEGRAFSLRRRISNMGTINPDAAKDYEELKTRYDYLAGQLADLDGARRSLAKINKVIDARMKDDFARTYEEVNKNFQEIFSILFPGGSAHLSLVDPDDMENTGVEVSAQPRGKRITKMMLMSGGEKSLTALALLFAIYRIRTTPFYILDEVEAALDDTNLRRLVAYIQTLRHETQLIMITHQRRTMEMADVLFGVSMQADGVTKVISQKLDRALEYAE